MVPERGPRKSRRAPAVLFSEAGDTVPYGWAQPNSSGLVAVKPMSYSIQELI